MEVKRTFQFLTDLITRAEAAEIIGCCTNFITYLKRTNALNHQMIGKRPFYDKKEVQEFAELYRRYPHRGAAGQKTRIPRPEHEGA